AMSEFSGANPNGTWSLYVDDNNPGDDGAIGSGWSLSITTIEPVNQLADIGVVASASPGSVRLGSPLTCTFVISNAGPNTANAVLFTNLLPANLSLQSAGSSQGISVTDGNLVSASVGSMAAG